MGPPAPFSHNVNGAPGVGASVALGYSASHLNYQQEKAAMASLAYARAVEDYVTVQAQLVFEIIGRVKPGLVGVSARPSVRSPPLTDHSHRTSEMASRESELT